MLRHLRQYSTRLAVQRGAKQSEGGGASLGRSGQGEADSQGGGVKP